MKYRVSVGNLKENKMNVRGSRVFNGLPSSNGSVSERLRNLNHEIIAYIPVVCGGTYGGRVGLVQRLARAKLTVPAAGVQRRPQHHRKVRQGMVMRLMVVVTDMVVVFGVDDIYVGGHTSCAGGGKSNGVGSGANGV